MSDYPAGSVKHDPATGSVAIRTVFPESGAFVNHAWLVATAGSGAITKTSADVESWTDIPIPAPAMIDVIRAHEGDSQ